LHEVVGCRGRGANMSFTLIPSPDIYKLSVVEFSKLPKDYNEFKRLVAYMAYDLLQECIQECVQKCKQKHKQKDKSITLQNVVVYLEFNFYRNVLQVTLKHLSFRNLLNKGTDETTEIAFIYCVEDNSLRIFPNVKDKDKFEQYVRMLYEVAILIDSADRPDLVTLIMSLLSHPAHARYIYTITRYYEDSTLLDVMQLAKQLAKGKVKLCHI